MIPSRIVRTLSKTLHSELECTRLVVCKVRSRDDGWIRCAVSENPPWYQRFCANYMRSRRRYPKVRTFIKRGLTLNALRRIAAGATEGTYIERLMAVVEEEARDRGHWNGRRTA